MDTFSGLKRTDHGLLFSKMLTAGFDLDRLSNLFLDGLRESFGVNRVALLLLHEETLTFRVAAFRGLHPDLAGNIRLRVDEGTACWLAMRGRLLRKERAVEEQGDPLMETIAREMDILGCVLSIPMMVDGKLIGILCLDEKVTDIPYSAPEMERLFILTDHMAEAAGNILRHRRLLEEVGSMKSLERQWKKNGELELLNELIGRMAHELRNPLVAIRTFTQLLKDRYEDPELREFFYTTVSGEVDRLNQLVERLTTFIQPIDYHFEEGEIRQLLDDTISEVFSVVQGRGIRVVKDYPREGYRVKVDRAQIRKAFAYLFQNALQSMTAGGTLTVRLVYSPDRVRLVVEDTGPGIPPEDLKRVFDPFYGASRGGTEMGLSLSQKIIEDHHGTVRVDSTLHQGTTLTVELPQADVFYGESHVRTKEHSGSG
jgi:signal transduction histidine kinase